MQVVDLFEARHGELLDERGHVDAVAHEGDLAQPHADLAQRAEIDVDDAVDAGALDLQHHGAHAGLVRERVGQDGPVGLPQ